MNELDKLFDNIKLFGCKMQLALYKKYFMLPYDSKYYSHFASSIGLTLTNEQNYVGKKIPLTLKSAT